MSANKLFAGPRVRRIRASKGLSQTAMAAELGVSASYLNLVERNQRPVTAQLLLRLSSTYQVSPSELTLEEGMMAALRGVFADPLIKDELAGDGEIAEFPEASPNVARAFLKLYRAYRESTRRLSDLGRLLAEEGHASSLADTRIPVDEVREIFEGRPNHYPRLEVAVTEFGGRLGRGDGLASALRSWLRSEHGIEVRMLPVAEMSVWRRRYDRHARRLYLSERMSDPDRMREIAQEAVLLAIREAIDAELDELPLSGDEARRLARFELGRYTAHALMMPYEDFRSAAAVARYDFEILRSRFGVSFAQAAERATTLGRQGASGLPFSLLEIDHAGNRIRRAGLAGFPETKFGGECPKLAVFEVFSRPGEIVAEAVETPDGSRFLTVARTVDGLASGFGERPRRTALMIICDLASRDGIAYADGLPLDRNSPGRPAALLVGPSCRTCERVACASRAEPPATRPLGLDEQVRGLSAFDFQG